MHTNSTAGWGGFSGGRGIGLSILVTSLFESLTPYSDWKIAAVLQVFLDKNGGIFNDIAKFDGVSSHFEQPLINSPIIFLIDYQQD